MGYELEDVANANLNKLISRKIRGQISGSGDNLTTFNARSNDDRTGQGQCTFSIFEGTTDYGDLLICDGANKPFFFRMEGTGANLNSRTFFAGEVLPSDKGKIDFEFISDEELYFQSKLENISPSWLTSTAL